MWQIVSCEGVDPPFNIYYSQFITWRATVKVVELYASPALLDTHMRFSLFCFVQESSTRSTRGIHFSTSFIFLPFYLYIYIYINEV